MKKVKIQDLKPGMIKGVQVFLPDETERTEEMREMYFHWVAFPLVAQTKKAEFAGGVLHTWHHVPVFCMLETHEDKEMFFFLSGTALMMFIDVENNQPKMDTAVVVRIPAGTQIIVDEGKGHFVPVAEGMDPVKAVVVSPKMPAPRMPLPEEVEGY